MGGFRKPTMLEELSDLKPDSEDYKAVKRRYDAIQKAQNERLALTNKMVNRILELSAPVREINKSKLLGLNNNKLIELGKAMKELHDTMDKVGVITHNTTRNRWSDDY